MSSDNVVALNTDKHVIAEIERLMASSGPETTSVIMTITPAVAAYLLEKYNKHNRPTKQRQIRHFQADMESEAWMLNGENVKFTDKMRLGDGQNRLISCVRANRPFRTHVVFGIPDAYFSTMDQGKVRDPSDVLHIFGIPNSRVVAQAVRWAELLSTNGTRRDTFTGPQILKLFTEKHRAVEDFLPEARRIATRNNQPIGLVIALLYLFDKADSQTAADFSAAWEAGTYEPRFRAIGSMQAELLSLRNRASGRVHDTVRAAMIIKAWNAARDGKKSASVKWEIGQPFPAIK